MPSAKRAARRKHAGWSRSSCRSGNIRSVARQVALNTADHETIAGAAMMNRPVAVVRQASSDHHGEVDDGFAGLRTSVRDTSSKPVGDVNARRSAASASGRLISKIDCVPAVLSWSKNVHGGQPRWRPSIPQACYAAHGACHAGVYPRQTRNETHRLKRRSKRGLISSKTGREAAPMAARFEPVPPGMSLGIARFSRDPTEIGKGSTASINHCKRP